MGRTCQEGWRYAQRTPTSFILATSGRVGFIYVWHCSNYTCYLVSLSMRKFCFLQALCIVVLSMEVCISWFFFNEMHISVRRGGILPSFLVRRKISFLHYCPAVNDSKFWSFANWYKSTTLISNSMEYEKYKWVSVLLVWVKFVHFYYKLLCVEEYITVKWIWHSTGSRKHRRLPSFWHRKM